MLGWIINLCSTADTREEIRQQPPVFYTEQGEPVYEVWFWHSLLRRWFVMSTVRNEEMEAQGVVYFHPREVPDKLRERMRAMERAAGLSCVDCGFPQYQTPSGPVCENGHGGAPTLEPDA
jgi:hypothetical protein